MNIAEAAASPFTGLVVWGCMIAGGVFLIAGLLVALLFDLPGAMAAAKAAKTAAAASNAATQAPGGPGYVVAEGAVADAAKAVADMASSLKDLTVATRLAMIGVFLVAVAAVAAGADALGKSDSGTPPATSTSTTK
jgi:hypothetical protein